MTTPATPPTPPTPPNGWPAPAAPPAARVSRRAVLLGAGGSVLVAGGLTAWIVGAGRSPSSAAPPAPAPSTPATTNAPTTAPDTATPTSVAPTAPSDRVLVVVQLSGGNDALNTLVPLTGGYHDARPTLGLADDTLLTLPGTTAHGLHPALAPLSPLLGAGRLAVVAGIGFPEPDRSHFAALDMWWSATPGETFRTGWLGRWLDATSTTDDVVLRAAGLGGAVPALRADTAPAVGINSLDRFALPDLDPAVLAAWTSLSTEHAAAASAAASVSALDLGLVAGEPAASARGEDSVATRLEAAAALIVTEPGVRVIHVSTGGYDTHADQLDTHARLLDELGTGLARFQQRLDESGQADRVLLVTTSEFGRRVSENGSGGSDHGRAGVSFAIGGPVRTTGDPIIGSIDPSETIDGDLRPLIDPRSLYATALDWLGPDAGLTDAVLGATFERLHLQP